MKEIAKKLEEIIKEKELDTNDFTPVLDMLVAGAEEGEKMRKANEDLTKENAESKESLAKIEKEKEELNSAIAEKEKELADLKIKYIERFSDSDGKESKNETKEDITIKDLFEEVK